MNSDRNGPISVKLCVTSVSLRWTLLLPQRHIEPQRRTETSLIRHFGMAAMLVIVGLLSSSFWPALSKEAKPADDPEIEQRIKALTEQCRCQVCQSETLGESYADTAA